MPDKQHPTPSSILNTAIIFATEAHRGAFRKGTSIPYILHPLEAAAIAATITVDHEVLAAAVLHDVLEDTAVTEAELREVFGSRVAELVCAESENKRAELPAGDTWRIRKQETLDALREEDRRDVKILVLADKLSNVRAIHRDFRALGDALWERFNMKDKDQIGWYYRSIAEALEAELGETPAWQEYRELVEGTWGGESVTMNSKFFDGTNEGLDAATRGRAKRKPGDSIICSVAFGGVGKSYYYLTEDDTLRPGDQVVVPVGTRSNVPAGTKMEFVQTGTGMKLVPVGNDGGTAIAEILKIESFSEVDAPFPLEKIKIIIRRCTDEDFASLQENERALKDICDPESSDPIEVDRPAQSILEPDSSEPIIKEQPDNEGHAQPFDSLVLCDEKTPYVQVFVWAEMSEGCLKVSGQDLGEAPRETFGENEYEYFYNFDRENTERLFALLTPEKQFIAGVLVREFSGMDGCSKLRDFCDENHIEYSFFTC